MSKHLHLQVKLDPDAPVVSTETFIFKDFSGGPEIKTLHLTRVQSMVGELRSHRPSRIAKKINK